ncbi:hypothetical protein ACWC2H_10390 [Streptomyces sp. 900105755]
MARATAGTRVKAVDSLNPYLHARGVACMFDNCSTTARLGARKWDPRFDYLLIHVAYPALDDKAVDPTPFGAFERHVLHQVLAVCSQMLPSVALIVA